MTNFRLIEGSFLRWIKTSSNFRNLCKKKLQKFGAIDSKIFDFTVIEIGT